MREPLKFLLFVTLLGCSPGQPSSQSSNSGAGVVPTRSAEMRHNAGPEWVSATLYYDTATHEGEFYPEEILGPATAVTCALTADDASAIARRLAELPRSKAVYDSNGDDLNMGLVLRARDGKRTTFYFFHEPSGTDDEILYDGALYIAPSKFIFDVVNRAKRRCGAGWPMSVLARIR